MPDFSRDINIGYPSMESQSIISLLSSVSSELELGNQIEQSKLDEAILELQRIRRANEVIIDEEVTLD